MKLTPLEVTFSNNAYDVLVDLQSNKVFAFSKKKWPL